jgi:hypothetical protein
MATVLAILPLFAGVMRAAESTPVKITCPGAICAPAPEAPSGPGVEDRRLPELVLVVRGIGKRRAIHESERDYEVKRVLYGSYSKKKIRLYDFSAYWYEYQYSSSTGDDDFLVAVAPSLHKEQTEYSALYHFPLSQERAEIVLCRARLDYAALSSTCIFIGKEVSLGWDDHENSGTAGARNYSWPSTVEVVRVISGEPLKAGERIPVGQNGAVRFSNLHQRAHPQPQIYFVSRDKGDGAKPVHEVLTHQPVDQEAKVLAALKHRDDYPVVTIKEDGVAMKTREITFLGTNAEAIDLLDAQNEGAVMLGYRALMLRRKTSRAHVIAAIENTPRLELPGNARGDVPVRKKRLIELLADMDREDGRRPAAREDEKGK